MAFLDIGVQIFHFAGTNGLEEVAEMIAAATELLDHLAVRVEGNGAFV